jgi:hypothetical protein
LTLATFLGAFLTQPALRLTSVEELDTGMRTWQPVPSDGRVIPWNIAITAQATTVPLAWRSRRHLPGQSNSAGQHANLFRAKVDGFGFGQ